MKPIKHLLLGAGWRDRTMQPGPAYVTLDINPDVEPDILHDLEVFPYPFDDDEFDSVTAHQVLEHTGNQGDHRFFFEQFTELWRILKPGGKLIADVPKWDSLWAFGDPSHKRIINLGTITFLSQQEYIDQIGKTPMTDFRHIYQADFQAEYVHEENDMFFFQLAAVKPSRYKR